VALTVALAVGRDSGGLDRLDDPLLSRILSMAEALACANCAATIREDYAEVAGWRY
jgi:hypothetical protein